MGASRRAWESDSVLLAPKEIGLRVLLARDRVPFNVG